MVKILICDPVHPDAVRMMEKAGIEVVYKPAISHEELLHEIKKYDAIIVRSRTKVTKDVIERAKNLKLIVRAGVGLDNIDLSEANKRGIVVKNTPDALTNAVAELALGLMFALARKISYCDSEMKKGLWVKKKARGIELAGKILGLIGFGRIGRCLADKALSLGMKVIAYDVIGIPEEYKKKGVQEMSSIEEVFKEADFISLHVPLTDKTYHLVNENLLKLMKKTSYLINTSRGAVVDTNALRKALKEGWIAGAALDVFEVEPPGDEELVKMENVVATPHIGSETEEAQRKAGLMAAEEVINFFISRKK